MTYTFTTKGWVFFQRITTITTTLQYSLEGHFVDGLENGNMEILQQCLRTYALIDKIKDAENLFRINVVRPYMEKVKCHFLSYIYI